MILFSISPDIDWGFNPVSLKFTSTAQVIVGGAYNTEFRTFFASHLETYARNSASGNIFDGQTFSGETTSATTISKYSFTSSQTGFVIYPPFTFQQTTSVSRYVAANIISAFSETAFTRIAEFNGGAVSTLTTFTNQAQANESWGQIGGRAIYSSRTTLATIRNISVSTTNIQVSPFTSTITDDATNPKFAITYSTNRFYTLQTATSSTNWTFASFIGNASPFVGVHELRSFNGIQFFDRTTLGIATSVASITPTFDSWDPWFARGLYPTVRTAPRSSPYDLGGIYTLSDGETRSILPYDNMEADMLQTFTRLTTTFSVGSATQTTIIPPPANSTRSVFAKFNSSMLNGTVIKNGASHPIFGLIDIEDSNGTYTAIPLDALSTNTQTPTISINGPQISRIQFDENFTQGTPIPYRSSAFYVNGMMPDGYVVPTFRKYFVGKNLVIGSIIATESYAGTLNSKFTGIAGFITFQQSVGGTVHSLKTGLTTENIQVSFFTTIGSSTFRQAVLFKETFSQITGIPTETQSSNFTTGRITKTYRSFNGSQANVSSNSQLRTVTGSFTISVSTIHLSNLSSLLAVTLAPIGNRTANPCHANLHNVNQAGSAIDARTYNLESGNDPNSLFTYSKFRNIGTVSTSAYYGYARGYLELNTARSIRPLDFLSPLQGSTNWDLVGKSNVYYPIEL